MLNDLTGPLVILHDVRQNAAQLVFFHELLAKESLARLGIPENSTEGLPELVGDGSGQLTQSGDPIQMSQIFLHLFQLLLDEETVSAMRPKPDENEHSTEDEKTESNQRIVVVGERHGEKRLRVSFWSDLIDVLPQKAHSSDLRQRRKKGT